MGFSVRFVVVARAGGGPQQQNYTPDEDEDEDVDSNANPNWQAPHSMAVSRNAGPQLELIVLPHFFGQRIMTLIWSCVQLREQHRVALVSLCQLQPTSTHFPPMESPPVPPVCLLTFWLLLVIGLWVPCGCPLGVSLSLVFLHSCIRETSAQRARIMWIKLHSKSVKLCIFGHLLKAFLIRLSMPLQIWNK